MSITKSKIVHSRGKSSRQKSEMIKQKNMEISMLKQQLKLVKQTTTNVRVEKNKRVTKKQLHEHKGEVREQKNKKIGLLKDKINRRDNKVEAVKGTVDELSLTIKEKNKEITALLRKTEQQAKKIQEIKNKKLRVRYIYVAKPLSAEAKRLKKILENGITDAKYKFFVNTVKIVNFAKDKRITPDLLAIILQIEMESSLLVRDMKTGTRSILNTGVRLELINYQMIQNTKHYYLTNKGTELVKEFKGFVSYSKL